MNSINFWHWFILGGVFLILELLSGSGFLLWIGLSAFLMGGVVFILPTTIWPWQMLLWAIFSLVTILLWWRYFKTATEENDQPVLNQRAKQYIGRVVTLETAIENGRGRVKIGDTLWRVAGDDMPEGGTVKVTHVEGVILFVEKA